MISDCPQHSGGAGVRLRRRPEVWAEASGEVALCFKNKTRPAFLALMILRSYHPQKYPPKMAVVTAFLARSVSKAAELPGPCWGADCRCISGGSSSDGVGPSPLMGAGLGAAFQLLLARSKVGVPGSETSRVTFLGELRDQPPASPNPALTSPTFTRGLQVS